MKPRSVLRYRHVPPATRAVATIVTLHDDRGGLSDLIPLAQSVDPELRIVSPEAARGVYSGIELVARTWFGGTLTNPEPASFGDSLAQLELFLLDARERWGEAGERPWLLGHGQGAVLALSLAVAAPDLVAGVLAVRGCLPAFSQPELLPAVPSALPVLLIGDRGETAPPVGAVEAAAVRLADLGMPVTSTWIAGARSLGLELAEEARLWFSNVRNG